MKQARTRYKYNNRVSCIGVLLGLLFALSAAMAQQPQDSVSSQPVDKDSQAESQIANLDAPLYNPFIERYVLDELKALRTEMALQRQQFTKDLVDRDLSIGDKAMSYATNSVTYFFYLIAGVSTLLVIVGWTSIRDIRERVNKVAEDEVSKLVERYEQRLQAIEQSLTQKTQTIDKNKEEIERTKETHALWLRAAQEHSPHGKISIYDEILTRDPKDAEALAYKADAVLLLDEPEWAKSLCQQALVIDDSYGYAYYQLACANVVLGAMDDALNNLEKALSISDSFALDFENDLALQALKNHPQFMSMIGSHKSTLSLVNKT